MYNVM